MGGGGAGPGPSTEGGWALYGGIPPSGQNDGQTRPKTLPSPLHWQAVINQCPSQLGEGSILAEVSFLSEERLSPPILGSCNSTNSVKREHSLQNINAFQ